MMSSIRAELIKQVHRPSTWLLLVTAVLLSLTFGYVIPYAGYSGAASGAPNADRGLAAMLPSEFIGTAIGGLPVFVGALGLILGVLVAGSEYGFETWKTVLAQRPSRVTAYGAKLVAVAGGTLGAVLSLFAVTAIASAVVATLEAQPMAWPSASEIAAGAAVGWLVDMMWASLGVLLGIALRSVALPIGLGLVWMLAVQNLLAGIAAPLLDWVAELQKVLPGPNAGALVAAHGANSGTPGVSAIVGSGHATIVLVGYLLAFSVAGGWLLHRRDIL
jgi:ABC-2 type transport system permease protein